MTTNVRKQFIGWGFEPNGEAVRNCGEFDTIEQAELAVEQAGLELAEVESVLRTDTTIAELYELDAQILALYREHKNEEGDALDRVFCKKCSALGLNAIAVSHAADQARKLQQALAANDHTYKTSPRTGRTYGVCKGLWK